MNVPVLICVLASIAAAFLFTGLFLTAEIRSLLRNKKILVPLIFYLVSKELLEAVFLIPFIQKINSPLGVSSSNFIRFDSTPESLLILFLWCLCAGWTTKLILQVTSGETVDLIAPLKSPNAWLPHTLFCVFLGGGFFVLLGKLLSIISPAYSLRSLTAAAAGSLIWNLTTSALLVVFLKENDFSPNRILKGIQVSISHVRSWAFMLIGQMLLLGWIVIPSSMLAYPASAFSTVEDMQWRVYGFWTGGYPDYSYWLHYIYAESSTTPDFFFLTLLNITFVILAITIKLKIVSDLTEEVPTRH